MSARESSVAPLDRVEALGRETLVVLELAREGGDARAILAAIREQRANLELVGRLKGDLAASGTVAVFMRFGVRDEAELRETLEAGRKLQALQANTDHSLESYRSDALQLLRLCLREKPEWRADVLAALGGEPVESCE